MTQTAAFARRTRRLGQKYSLLMTASTQIWAGSMVQIVAAGTASPALAGAGNQGVRGIALESKLSAAAAMYITIQECEALMTATSIAITDLGLRVYASADDTVDETQGANEPQAGLLVEVVSSTSCWVRIGWLEAVI